MPVAHYLHIGLLVILLGAQLLGRSFWYRTYRIITVCTVLGTFCVSAYYTHAQFLVWQSGGGTSAYLLPPYEGIGYFLGYSFWHFFAPYVLSGSIALIAYIVTTTLNHRFEDRFFHATEPGIIAVCIFTIGHPFWIAYISLTLSCYLAASIFRRMYKGDRDRITFYYFWLPIAIICLLLLPLFSKLTPLVLLKV